MDIIVLRLFCELVWCQWFVVRAFQSISLMSTANSWCERGQLTRVTRPSRLPCSHQHWRWMCFDASIHIQLRVIWGHCRTISTKVSRLWLEVCGSPISYPVRSGRDGIEIRILYSPCNLAPYLVDLVAFPSYRHLKRGNCV